MPRIGRIEVPERHIRRRLKGTVEGLTEHKAGEEVAGAWKRDRPPGSSRDLTSGWAQAGMARGHSVR